MLLGAGMLLVSASAPLRSILELAPSLMMLISGSILVLWAGVKYSTCLMRTPKSERDSNVNLPVTVIIWVAILLLLASNTFLWIILFRTI